MERQASSYEGEHIQFIEAIAVVITASDYHAQVSSNRDKSHGESPVVTMGWSALQRLLGIIPGDRAIMPGSGSFQRLCDYL